MLERIYYNGEGGLKDYQKSLYWYKKAAKQLDGKALYALGNCYEHGLGVVQNDRKACYC